jgi:hypothetical protein
MRPTIAPRQATSIEPPQPGVVVGAVDLCVRLAAVPARLRGPAQTLTEGVTHLGTATRYLTRCADLAERAPGLAREVDLWAGSVGPLQTQLAVRTAQHLADQLADALDARVGAGW